MPAAGTVATSACSTASISGNPDQGELPASIKAPSVEATIGALEALSGIDIQYSVLIDLHGFQQLVRAVGGLTVDVMQRTPIGGGTSRVSGYIAPDVPNLDGYRALWYASFRQGSSNQERMARQRCVLTAMLQQLNAHTVLLKFQELVRPGGSIVRTEIPQEQLGMLVDLALKAKTQKVWSVNFLPALINPWSYDPAMVRSTAGRRISASMVESSIHTATSAGGGPSSGAARKYSSGPARNAGTPTAPPGAGTAESDLASVCSTA